MITLILGGARSGKSAVAERRASALAAGRHVVYVATGLAGNDDDFAQRISAHRERRPVDWETVEAGAHLIDSITRAVPPDAVAMVDSLGTWVGAQPGFAVNAAELVEVLATRTGPTIVVSEEVGLGVHPGTEVGRRFRDALGELNQAVAEVADEVLLVVAGRTLPLARP